MECNISSFMLSSGLQHTFSPPPEILIRHRFAFFDHSILMAWLSINELKRKQMQQSQCVKKCGSDRGQGLKSYLENVQMSAESYLTQTKALYAIEYNNTYMYNGTVFSAHFHSA